ncbi:hypothetical protein [Micromonospora tarensis]|uniref:hypothetical protein n=1 Tax=Micromonospora tarensis TaxID=2806100 RepID=UPI001EE3D308|nr:hypothetical protein [Micromonospora tarensis]
MTSTVRPSWVTSTVRPDDPDAVLLLREYMTEMVVRYHRRPARPARSTRRWPSCPATTWPAGWAVPARSPRR